MRSVCVIAAFACCIISTAASAATLADVTGKVSVNRGTGLSPASSGTFVKPGDLVVAGPASGAEIIFENGCRQKVDAGTVVRVSARACQNFASRRSFLISAAVIGGAVGAGIALTNNDHNPPASP